MIQDDRVFGIIGYSDIQRLKYRRSFFMVCSTEVPGRFLPPISRNATVDCNPSSHQWGIFNARKNERLMLSGDSFDCQCHEFRGCVPATRRGAAFCLNEFVIVGDDRCENSPRADENKCLTQSSVGVCGEILRGV